MAVRWRWEEKDFGFRFRKAGKARGDYYQSRQEGDFYVVPAEQCKLGKATLDELVKQAMAPTTLRVVANPWSNYELGWDWITSGDGLCLNFAGCLDREEVERREDEGVARAMAHVEELALFETPAPTTVELICELHRALMGEIYPFAGDWRTVDLHKGAGPTRWPLPPQGIEPLMAAFKRDVLRRTPFLSEHDEEVFAFTSELMNELLAIHPFREGNGRSAFVVANLILMQNDLLPLNVYDRHRDEVRYFGACDEGRIHRDYQPLADLLAEWQDQAQTRWEAEHGA